MAAITVSNVSGNYKEISVDLSPFIKTYKDGSVERLLVFPNVPPSPEGDPQTGVLSKDITISDEPTISARIYLPKLTTTGEDTQKQKLPVLVYFHAGGFCVGSVFNVLDNRYLTSLVSKANIIAVCIEYRLAPEHPLPAAYDDCWTALQWVASHSADNLINSEPWLSNHGDFKRFYVGGDSAGGNITHNVAMRAGAEKLCGDVNILGAFLSHPYFWGSKPVGSEPFSGHEECINSLIWNFAFPSSPGGVDNPMINPMAPGSPSLAGLACSKLLVCVAGKDRLRERGVLYMEAVRNSGWQGKLELCEFEEEDHCFQIFHYESVNSERMIKRLASFIHADNH